VEAFARSKGEEAEPDQQLAEGLVELRRMEPRGGKGQRLKSIGEVLVGKACWPEGDPQGARRGFAVAAAAGKAPKPPKDVSERDARHDEVGGAERRETPAAAYPYADAQGREESTIPYEAPLPDVEGSGAIVKDFAQSSRCLPPSASLNVELNIGEHKEEARPQKPCQENEETEVEEAIRVEPLPTGLPERDHERSEKHHGCEESVGLHMKTKDPDELRMHGL